VLQRMIGESITLRYLPAPDLWSVLIDPSQVDQILTNLCLNARDAIGGVGSVLIATANVVIDANYCAVHAEAQPGDFGRLTVRDTGQGMDETTLAHLFEPFFTTKAVGEGTGLGLASVHGIVAQNRGFISVTSRLGLGTTFDIHLPRQSHQEAHTDQPAVATPVEAGRGTILLVEDEPALLHLVSYALTGAGYTVLSTGHPLDALRLAGEHDSVIDLIVTDVMMPEMTGQQLAKAISALRPATKCLFMSGYPANTVSAQGALQDDVAFLQKPFAIAALVAAVRATLNSGAR